MRSSPPTHKERVVEWARSLSREDVASAVRDGRLDESAFASSRDGFTWGAVLLGSSEPLAWALEEGWRADKPCCFFASSNGRGDAWRPFEAVAYGLGPNPPLGSRAPEALRALLAAGVAMESRNPFGETALHHAARLPAQGARDEEIPSALLAAILSDPPAVHAVASGGRTALHVARGAWNIVDLLRAGADSNARDARGARAVDVILGLPEGPGALAIYERGLLQAFAPRSMHVGAARRL